MTKIRLDRLLVERGHAGSREKAQALILSGDVFVNGQKAEKCGAAVDSGAALRVDAKALKYASRAGVKLEGALCDFGIEARGKTCLDAGASTGGFTDCLLQHGAARVFAVDVGTNQLDWKLRQDSRVTSLEKTDARTLSLERLGAPADLALVDVSFISCRRILPALPPLLKPGADLLVLVKPQFEVGRGRVGKGGVVRDPKLHQQAVAAVVQKLEEMEFTGIASVESVLPGAEGNREFFVRAIWKKA
ncbi:MAG: TlyA family RNA methyltransferase [Terriglobia bacterium]